MSAAVMSLAHVLADPGLLRDYRWLALREEKFTLASRCALGADSVPSTLPIVLNARDVETILDRVQREHPEATPSAKLSALSWMSFFRRER